MNARGSPFTELEGDVTRRLSLWEINPRVRGKRRKREGGRYRLSSSDVAVSAVSLERGPTSTDSRYPVTSFRRPSFRLENSRKLKVPRLPSPGQREYSPRANGSRSGSKVNGGGRRRIPVDFRDTEFFHGISFLIRPDAIEFEGRAKF